MGTLLPVAWMRALPEFGKQAIAPSRLGGGDRQGKREVGFAYAWRPEENHVLTTLDEPSMGDAGPLHCTLASALRR
jgi:hypothetical protein